MTFLKKMTHLAFLILFFGLGTSPAAQAQFGSKPDISDFSLEDIFDLEVEIASKQSEPLAEAPGVVSVLTEAEIKTYGARTLYDLLERIPAINNVFTTGINRTVIRGGDGFTSIFHILLLIDGRPLRAANGNVAVYNPTMTFPINIIKRIEIIRGPGSVLYGTNAFEGVINVITKKDSDVTYTVTGGYGSDTTNLGQFDFHRVFTDGEIHFGMAHFDTEGWDTEHNFIATDEAGQPFAAPYSGNVFQDEMGMFLNVSYKDFNVSVFHGLDKQWSEAYSPLDLSYRSQVSMINLQYKTEINENWRVEANLTRNVEDFDFDFTAPDGSVIPAVPIYSEDYLLEVTTYGDLGNNVRMLVGTVYQELSGDSEETILNSFYEDETSAASAYLQIDYKPSRFLKLIGGAQWNKPQEIGGDLVPRIGAIVNFSPSLGTKILYGEAFRSPILTERRLQIEGFQEGDPLLEPEKISTFDFQIFNRGDNHEVVLTYFNSEQKDLIQVVPKPDLVIGRYENVGGSKVTGFELEGKVIPSPGWIIQGSLTTQDNENELGVEDWTLMPNMLWKLGVAYTRNNFSAGMFNTHSEAFEGLGLFQANPEPNSFDMLSLNLNYTIPQLSDKMNVELNLLGQNILDEETWIPEITLRATNTIPGYGARSFLGTVTVRF